MTAREREREKERETEEDKAEVIGEAGRAKLTAARPAAGGSAHSRL